MIPGVMRISRRDRGDTAIKFLYKTLKITEVFIRLILVNITSGSLVEIVGARRCDQCTGNKQKLGES